MADSGQGTVAMEEGEADATCDEEVEGQDEGAMARAVPKIETTDITWDPEDPYLKFTNENFSTV